MLIVKSFLMMKYCGWLPKFVSKWCLFIKSRASCIVTPKVDSFLQSRDEAPLDMRLLLPALAKIFYHFQLETHLCKWQMIIRFAIFGFCNPGVEITALTRSFFTHMPNLSFLT